MIDVESGKGMDMHQSADGIPMRALFWGVIFYFGLFEK
jgi:hypothetical protein